MSLGSNWLIIDHFTAVEFWSLQFYQKERVHLKVLPSQSLRFTHTHTRASKSTSANSRNDSLTHLLWNSGWQCSAVCSYRQCVLGTVTTHTACPCRPYHRGHSHKSGPYSENHRHTWGTKLCWHWFSTEPCVCSSSLLKLLLRWADMHKSWTLGDYTLYKVHVFLRCMFFWSPC